MGLIAGFFLKFFTGTALSFVSNIVGKLSDAHVAIVQAQTGLDATKVTGVVEAERTRLAAVSNVTMAAMTHPVWWIGWVLFVIPVGLYDAIIHGKSILCPFWSFACTWDILRVPPTQESWDMYVVLSFFGLAATSSVITSIAQSVGKH